MVGVVRVVRRAGRRGICVAGTGVGAARELDPGVRCASAATFIGEMGVDGLV